MSLHYLGKLKIQIFCKYSADVIELSVTLPNLNRFSKFCTAGIGKCTKFATKTIKHYHLTFGILLHNLRKLKIQIFCRHSVDMEENANKLHFKCTDFNSCMQVTVYAECICVFIKILSPSLNTMLIVEQTVVTSAVTNFRCHKLIVKVNE